MKLENTLRIPVPAEEAWRVLLDIERIAPCVPGATLTSHDGDRFQGRVKVKLGPIGLAYSGTVAFVSRDEAAKVAVMEAAGRETRGGGTAKAVVTCRLTGDGDATDVLVETDLAITGKPAQFGRSTLADVATALIDRFAANLAAELAAEPAATPRSEAPGEDAAARRPAAGGGTASAPRAGAAPPASAEPVDLLQAVGGGTLERVAPIAVVAALLGLLLGLLLGRRHRCRESR